MLSKHWHATNNRVYFAIMSIPFFFVPLFSYTDNRLRLLLITLVTAMVCVALTLYLRRRSASGSFYRTLKMDYQDAEFAVRKLFKNENMRFRRELNDESMTYSYAFPGHGVKMHMQLYDLVNGVALPRDAVSDMVLVDSLGLLVTISGINASNRTFAQRLAAGVDQLAQP